MINEFFQYVSQELITPELISVVLTTIAGIIGAFLIRIIKAASNWINVRLSSDQISIINRIAYTAVMAVEKTFEGEEGQRKKDAAVGLIRESLSALGIDATYEQISTAIEAAILEFLDSKGENSVTTSGEAAIGFTIKQESPYNEESVEAALRRFVKTNDLS